MEGIQETRNKVTRQLRTVLMDSVKPTLMNDNFSTNAENLISNHQPTQNHSEMHHVYRISPTCSDFILHYPMILKDISTINPRKATGHDRVSPRDLK